ncbi:PREDICTED: uncharacterized protein LOC109217453 [Nicotiana attenuata]|uniref:uncharacterized protein LOC109217453 n=1 Tax=Nicotiana attenuata TaxID=49451 RepID=UPI00090461D3|nr:PREDICTED: uncharacterized protein LOC109217453 [Nicotiana attenuata]
MSGNKPHPPIEAIRPKYRRGLQGDHRRPRPSPAKRRRQHKEGLHRAQTLRARYARIPKDIATHRLNIDPLYPPVRQIRRKFNAAIIEAVSEEVDKLLTNDSIRESKYPQWVANMVMIKKKNGKWRMCVDFTDLNKACPKDSFLLPYIDQLIDATAGHELLSFLDAYSGYNQILMAEEDQEKMTFITHQGTYCYKVMSFGLKNAGATYQRLVTEMFKEQLGKTTEVYIDDMLVKSAKKEDYISHLKEAFEILRRYGMKLNPEKCAFGVASGKFLGFLVSQRGIEVNPDQIKAIDTIHKVLTSKKQVQKLTGRIVALSRFISRSSDRCHKFFNVLRKYHELQWNEECIDALRKLKTYMSSPPLLVKADPGECLLVYLAVSKVAVNESWSAKTKRLQRYQSKIRKLVPEFDECHLDQIPKAQNMEADGLAKLAAATKNINKESVITLLHSAIDHIEILYLNLTWDWRNRIVSYLPDGILPQDKKEAKKLRVQAARYSLVNHDLYKSTFGGPLAKCLGPHQTRQVLEEVHEGHCGAHTGNRALVRYLIRAGYYWPTMKKEAADYVRRYEQ